MTLRAVFFGLAAAMFIAMGGFLCSVYAIPPPTYGHFPIAVFGFLFITLVLVNPMLSLIRIGWKFSAGELSVVLGMALVACNLPSAGLMSHWQSVIVSPRVYAATVPGWKKGDLIQYAPDAMMISARYEEPAVKDWVEQKGWPTTYRSLSDIPWGAWRKPITTWTTLVLLVAAAVIGMALVVHRQWAFGERLRYPIAEFTTTVLSQQTRAVGRSLFRTAYFWVPFLIFLLIRLTGGWNIINANVITIPLQLDFTGFASKFPDVAKLPGAGSIMNPRLIPLAAAFVFFLGSDIGLSLGISNILSVILFSVLIVFGVELSGTEMEGGPLQWQGFGAFLGYGLLVIYLGRRHYLLVLRQAVGLGRSEESPAHAVWGCRMLLLASAAMVAVLTVLGLAWSVALLLVLMMLLMALVLARMNAECGVFFFRPIWAIPGVMFGLLGMQAMGPTGMAIVGLVSVMLLANPFEHLIPYVINALRISDRFGVTPERSSKTMGGAYVLALVLLIPLVVWVGYNYHGGADHRRVVERAMSGPQRAVSMMGPGELRESESMGALQRMLHADLDGGFLIAVGVGLMCVLLLGQLRMRLTWWPLHPILILGFASTHVAPMSFSFLLGWGIKEAVTRLGGGRAYQLTKIIMIGVIAGELVGGLSWMIINLVLVFVTGFSWAWLMLW